MTEILSQDYEQRARKYSSLYRYETEPIAPFKVHCLWVCQWQQKSTNFQHLYLAPQQKIGHPQTLKVVTQLVSLSSLSSQNCL